MGRIGTMATYLDVKNTAESATEPYVDGSTPDGQFGVTVKFLGVVTVYRFLGTVGDEGASIVSRTELSGNAPATYFGSGLKGGSLVHSATRSA